MARSAKSEKVVANKVFDGLLGEVLKAILPYGKATTVKAKAREVAELALISASISRVQASYKDLLIEKQVYECFPDLEIKVESQAPKTQSHIDAVKLAKYLLKNGREKELLAIISVSEKLLKDTLKDGETLANKYRVADPDTAAGLKVGPMTKAELAAHSVTME